jgi:5,10-methylenetetrahydromethanopterin reductase
VRYGITFFPAMPVAEATDLARLAEDLGYADLWILDQSFHHDPFVLLAACAAATSSIRLGVAVTNPVTRHPVQIARAAATLVDLSSGRFVLGLGAGNRTRVLPALGLPTDRAAARVSEAVDVCRRLLAGEEVTMRGQTVVLDGVRLELGSSTPVPIFVGSRGPAILRIAGAKADGAFVEALFTPEGVEYALGEIRSGARAAGRDVTDLEVVAWQALRLSTTAAAADEQRYRRWAALLMRSTGAEVLERLGIAPETVRAVREAFTSGGVAAAGALVPEGDVARLVLTGEPDEVASQLGAVSEHGIDTVSVIGFGNTDVVQDTLRRFAQDVMARSLR